MNVSRAFVLAAFALVTGFLTARWLPVQAAEASPAREASLGVRQLEAFHAYLVGLKQEEALRRFGEYSSSSLILQNSADLGLTMAVLNRIRGGNLDGAIQLLEMRMSSAIVGFDASYQELPSGLRGEVSLKVLEHAKAYRDKFPAKDPDRRVAEMEAKAFKLLKGKKEG